MASTRERVRFSGTIRGEGRMANCSVWATKVTLIGANDAAYADYSIDDVSDDLPDGDYSVTANGQTIPIARRNGFWVSR
jgi:S-adenosylhomocysteine hydrolase